jgi:hypothetical protein
MEKIKSEVAEFENSLIEVGDCEKFEEIQISLLENILNFCNLFHLAKASAETPISSNEPEEKSNPKRSGN